MLRFLLAALALAPTVDAYAQIPITAEITIDTRRDTFAISPYIFGSNGQADDRDEHIAAVRSGGNRLTGYNWENNASNAGSDYVHHSDNYLTRFLPSAVQNVPAIALTSFHDSVRAIGAYSLVTLPAAGYVARDKNGTVSEAETAPSARWDEVRFLKGAPFSLVPDLDDGVVYVDEEVNFLVDKLGSASRGGIRGYAVDNEPALWPTTHPRIHPQKTTVAEVVAASVAVGRAVKSVDPDAEVFGAVSYGFGEYLSMQEAPDWQQYASYGTFINAYLAKMSEAEAQYGRRLVDVLDLHWYPEARGRANNGEDVRISLEENSDPGVAIARMQAPRTLWDSTYRENSWIGEWFSPVALIPSLNASIAARYPGTKLAFTEINYGGAQHVSGGIAMADVLGIFADHGVYMSNYWGEIEGFTSAAYRLYRSYDGAGASFGDVRVFSTTSDRENSAVHASIASSGAGEPEGTLHIVAINRNPSQPLDAVIDILSDHTYASARVVGFDESSPQIRVLAERVELSSGDLRYTLPPLTAAHFILRPAASSAVRPEMAPAMSLVSIAPNPAHARAAVRLALPEASHIEVALVDLFGRERRVSEGMRSSGEHVVDIGLDGLAAGFYQVVVRSADRVVTGRIAVE